MSRESVAHNIPFVYVLSFTRNTPVPGTGGGYYSILPNCMNANSYFIYAGLVYGAKGLAYWNSSWRWGDYRITQSHREFVRNLHKTITDSEEVLLSLQFKSAYHKSNISTLGFEIDSIPPESEWQHFMTRQPHKSSMPRKVNGFGTQPTFPAAFTPTRQ